MKEIIVLDTETTGIDPLVDKIVEIAAINLHTDLTFETLVNPGRDIPPEAMAVHHITEWMVEGKPDPQTAGEMFIGWAVNNTGLPIFCAHNAKFDRGMMQPLLGGLAPRWLCTMKVAKALWPDAPGYSNQVLRYWLGLKPQIPEGLAPPTERCMTSSAPAKSSESNFNRHPLRTCSIGPTSPSYSRKSSSASTRARPGIRLTPAISSGALLSPTWTRTFGTPPTIGLTSVEVRVVPVGNSWSAELSPYDIEVRRDERQRRELTGIEELADSIARRGQLQPVVIQRDTNVLIAGERRLTAIKLLWETEGGPAPMVRAVYSDEMDPGELKALEFEENAKRLDLPWQDNCLAVLDYHSYKLSVESGWSQTKTAQALGFAIGKVSQWLTVAEALRSGNRMVAESPKLSTAVGIVQRANERREASETSKLVTMVARPIAAATTGSTGPSAPTPEIVPESSGHILNEDFAKWAKTYVGPKFNLIHCDFPYGVGMHKSEQGSGDAYGTYEDTPDVYFKLLRSFMERLDNYCEDSAHLVFWFSMDYYEVTRRILSGIEEEVLGEGYVPPSSSWRVNPFPLVWHKTDGSGIIPDAQRGPRRTYETAFLASRGDRKIVRAVSNVVGSPIQRGRHMSEKPQAVLGHFFRMLVDEHTALLDPTCGSGSAIRAAYTAGASRYLGLEINPVFAKHADEDFRDFVENPLPEIEELLNDKETLGKGSNGASPDHRDDLPTAG